MQAHPLTSHLPLPSLHLLAREWEGGSGNATCLPSGCELERRGCAGPEPPVGTAARDPGSCGQDVPCVLTLLLFSPQPMKWVFLLL